MEKTSIELQLLTYNNLLKEDIFSGEYFKLCSFESMGSIGINGRFKGISINYSSAAIACKTHLSDNRQIELLCKCKIDLENSLQLCNPIWRLDIGIFSKDMYSMDLDSETKSIIHHSNLGIAISFYAH